jgi:integrase/recombinase XerD
MGNLTVVEPRAAPAIERDVEEYLDDCRSRGLSPKTVNHAYGYPLRHVFLPWCAREGIADPTKLTKSALNRLSVELLDQGGKKGQLSRWSVKTYLRSINGFLAYAKAEAEKVGEKVDAKAQIPKTPRALVDVLSREELQSLEDKAPTERDKLIIRILADTGLRVGELCGLRVNDLIKMDRRPYLKVWGKGSRERLVPLPRLQERLQKYVQRSRPQDSHSDRVFLSLRRRPGGGYEPLTPSGVGQLLDTAAERAGITKRVYPHLLRHSFATWQLQRGTSTIALKDVLGHSSLAMIANVYSHLSPQDAYEAIAKSLIAEDDGRR